ncbi:MAG TPA: ABC transporter permease [Verrucomicrobiae bacterium]|nr:ABC transporter permease [Verrucomicrobiae bacterium]
MLNDFKLALRQLLKNPGFTTVAVLSIALGIGACTSIFTVVNSVLLRPMPYPDSGRLVILRQEKLPDVSNFAVTPGDYFSWLEQTKSFDHLAAEVTGNYNLTGHGDPLRLNVRFVTANYLRTFGVQPSLGRDFAAEEETSGREKVVLLSHGFWTRQMGGATDVLNQTLRLDGNVFTIIGVLPKSFRPETMTDLYLPAVYNETLRRDHGPHFLDVTGRLKPGVTLAQAREEVNVVAARLAGAFPATNKEWSVAVNPLLEYTVGSSKALLFALQGAVAFLLLIACANIANLLLARATGRVKEMSVRAALGASRARILRQLLTESVLLSGLGGVLALLVAQWGVNLLVAHAPGNIPRVDEIAVDARAFALTCGLAIVTGIGFGITPAFQAVRINPADTLKDAGRGSIGSYQGRGLRNALVVAEIAIALILLVGAGLFTTSFLRLSDVSPGFQPDNVAIATLTLVPSQYPAPSQKAGFAARVADQIATIPGVKYASAATMPPFSGNGFRVKFTIGGRPALDPGVLQATLYYAVTPDYFRAMGIPLLRGRFFDSRDAADRPRVSIISESMARKFFPGEDPVGKRINFGNGPEAYREIIGVTADVKQFRLEEDGDSALQAYDPFAQQPYDFMTFVVRTSGPAPALPDALRRAVAAVDKNQPVASVQFLAKIVSDSLARPRFSMFLFTVFSVAALLLAAIGIYGVMAYSVNCRIGEIGIRMALGAQRADVFRLIFFQGGRLVILGLACGLGGALCLTRYVSSMLYNVGVRDPAIFVAITFLLAAVAALACLLPARRAAGVDPMTALRQD